MWFIYFFIILFILFFFNDTATTEIYTLSLHDALPISFTDDPSSISTEVFGIENISRAMSKASETELTRLEKALPFLATTGGTAPFIGLFGTVWGIMTAFRVIGLAGSASLVSVAPGISEEIGRAHV